MLRFCASASATGRRSASAKVKPLRSSVLRALVADRRRRRRASGQQGPSLPGGGGGVIGSLRHAAGGGGIQFQLRPQTTPHAPESAIPASRELSFGSSLRIPHHLARPPVVMGRIGSPLGRTPRYPSRTSAGCAAWCSCEELPERPCWSREPCAGWPRGARATAAASPERRGLQRGP